MASHHLPRGLVSSPCRKRGTKINQQCFVRARQDKQTLIDVLLRTHLRGVDQLQLDERAAPHGGAVGRQGDRVHHRESIKFAHAARVGSLGSTGLLILHRDLPPAPAPTERKKQQKKRGNREQKLNQHFSSTLVWICGQTTTFELNWIGLDWIALHRNTKA